MNGNDNGSYSGDLDVYKYWVLSCWARPFDIFPGLSYLSVTPNDDFPYDTMQVFYVWKLEYSSKGLVSTTNMTINWKFFCIPR